MKKGIGRHHFLGTTLALSASTGFPVQAAQESADEVALSLEDNIYTRLLGVRPHIGAHEHISRLADRA